MGLLDRTMQNTYYQGGEKGEYQFTSLENIIDHPNEMIKEVLEIEFTPRPPRPKEHHTFVNSKCISGNVGVFNTPSFGNISINFCCSKSNTSICCFSGSTIQYSLTP